MAIDDDERGIDWLASQLDPSADDMSTDDTSTDDTSAGDTADDGLAPAVETPRAESADAGAPTSRFGRRARRVTERIEEPVLVTPAAPPVAATPAGPAPWWTTPLPQPVETDAAAEESTDPLVAAAGVGHESAVPVPAGSVPNGSVPIESAPVTSIPVEPTVLLPVSEAPADVETAGIRLTETEAEAESDQPTELLPAQAAGGEGVPAAAAGTAAAEAAAASPEPPSRHRSRRGAPVAAQAALIWTAVGLIAVIVLVGLFYLGQRFVASPVAAPQPTASATPTPTPTPTPIPTPEITAMQPVGVHEWNTLFGGECLEPYGSPWEEDFTVVDCAAAHTAQLVYRGNFGGDAATAFPGEAALAAQINLLCTAPGILDLNAAGAYPNLQMQGSYPISEDQWTDEPPYYFCFASRASAEPLTASIRGAGPTA